MMLPHMQDIYLCYITQDAVFVSFASMKDETNNRDPILAK